MHSTTISSYNDFKGFPGVISVAFVYKIFHLFIEQIKQLLYPHMQTCFTLRRFLFLLVFYLFIFKNKHYLKLRN